ncbi:hypothetical protein [Legionella sp. 16cNR16C]|nr:hypothetical protein [Legionella sp. 16cNR16C]MCE3045470.1 hypothetical protein [Legionella sp. 16cNR16C]
MSKTRSDSVDYWSMVSSDSNHWPGGGTGLQPYPVVLTNRILMSEQSNEF